MTLEERVKAALPIHPDNNDLRLLASGWSEARRRYAEDKSAANRKEWKALEKDLVQILDALPAPQVQPWPDVLENVEQVYRYLLDCGYRVRSKQTLHNHVRAYKLVCRQDGRFDRRTVDSYATKVRLERSDIPPERAKKLATEVEQIDLRPLIDVKRDIAEEDLKKARLNNKAALGAVVDILLVDREQQELCQAVRMHLSPMIRATAEQILSMLGGDPDAARQMIAMVGGDESRADDLSAWIMGRKSEVVQFYKPYLRRALDVFASGQWLTPEMREAWAAYQQQREDAELKDIQALLRMAGGDEGRAMDVLEQFYVRRFDNGKHS